MLSAGRQVIESLILLLLRASQALDGIKDKKWWLKSHGETGVSTFPGRKAI